MFQSGNGRTIFLEPQGAEAGLYLWAARSTHGLLPHYVGETADSFARRHLDHFKAHATGGLLGEGR